MEGTWPVPDGCWPARCVSAWSFWSVLDIKGKVRPGTGHEGQEGALRYVSILSLTSALDGVGG